jgi:flagellar biosynthesis protein FlhB
MGGNDKTEKATPKRREEARKKGQVAKSADLNGAIVLLAALFALSATAPHLVEVLQTNMRAAFALISSPEVVGHRGLGPIVTEQGRTAALAALPVVGVCLLAGILVNVAQVGGKPRMQALKPDPKRLNPLQGAKNIFGPNAMFEGAKNVVKSRWPSSAPSPRSRCCRSSTSSPRSSASRRASSWRRSATPSSESPSARRWPTW